METFQRNTQEILILRKDLWDPSLRCSDRSEKRKEKFEFRVGILLALGSKAQEVELEQREVNSEANEVSGPGF